MGMNRYLTCNISMEDPFNPACELVWNEPTPSRNNFTSIDPPEVYYSYGDSVQALTNAIMRIEGLSSEEARRQAERDVYTAMTQAMGSSSEIWTQRRQYRWRNRW